MKKIISLILLIFIVVGCSNATNDQYKDNAINAYVNSSNRLNDLGIISLELNGDIKVLKSALVEEEVNSNINGSMSIDLDKFLMKMSFDIQSNGKNESILVYMDKEYIYIYTNKEWIKQPISDQAINSEEIKAKPMTYEQALAFFNSFNSISYQKESINGIDGYTISGKVNVMKLINSLVEQQNINEQIEGLTEIEQLFKSIDLNFNTFVSEDINTFPKYIISINSNVLGVNFDLGPFEIKTGKSAEKIIIPSAAKNAELQTQEIEV